MTEYPNMLSKSLLADKDFLKLASQAVNQLYASHDTLIYNSPKAQAKVFENGKERFLVVQKENINDVYRENVYSSQDQPFQYIVKALKNKTEIYDSPLLSCKIKEDKKEKSILAEMLDKLNKSSNNKTTVTMDELKEIVDSFSFKTTSSSYGLKSFFDFLQDKGCLSSPIKDEFWLKHSQSLCNEIENLSDIKIDTQFLFEVVKKHKLTSSNKHEFNDMDNHLWKQHSGLVMTDQNCGFYITKEENGFTYYAFDKENQHGKKHTTLSALVKNLSADSPIDNMALKIENDKVVFADNAFINSLVFDLHHTKLSCMEEYNEAPSYSVDLNSYDYQLAFHQERYGMTEFAFVAQAVLTLGGGFDYDEKKGRFFSDSVMFDEKLLDYQKQPEPDTIKKFDYCYPKKISGPLDEKWLAGIEYMVEVLKRDKPVPVVSETKDKKADVLKTIDYFEKVLNKMKKTNKNKP